MIPPEHPFNHLPKHNGDNMAHPDHHQISMHISETWRNGQRAHLTVKAFDRYTAYIGILPLEDRKNYGLGLQADSTIFEEIREKLHQVPNEHIYPRFDQGMTQFHGTVEETALNENYFYKRPDLSGYRGNDMIARAVLAEVQINEKLLRHPHPNLAVYAGCLVRDGLIVSLVFRRYSKTLTERVANAKSGTEFSAQERSNSMDSIEDVAKHLHRLDLAHNDICPPNIMFDHDNKPILSDFDACAPLGSKIVKGGHVTGWRGPLFDDGQVFEVSSVNCDILAIQFLRKWLSEE